MMKYKVISLSLINKILIAKKNGQKSIQLFGDTPLRQFMTQRTWRL